MPRPAPPSPRASCLEPAWGHVNTAIWGRSPSPGGAGVPRHAQRPLRFFWRGFRGFVFSAFRPRSMRSGSAIGSRPRKARYIAAGSRVPWDEAFDSLLEERGLTYKIDGKTI